MQKQSMHLIQNKVAKKLHMSPIWPQLKIKDFKLDLKLSKIWFGHSFLDQLFECHIDATQGGASL